MRSLSLLLRLIPGSIIPDLAILAQDVPIVSGDAILAVLHASGMSVSRTLASLVSTHAGVVQERIGNTDHLLLHLLLLLLSPFGVLSGLHLAGDIL